MSLNLKQLIGAGLLTLAVVGGAATYFNAALKTSPTATVAVDGVTSEPSQFGERHAEVIVTEGQAS